MAFQLRPRLLLTGATQRAIDVFGSRTSRHWAQEGLSERGKSFLMTAARGQMLQLEPSRVAIERSKNPQIRRFVEATVKFVVERRSSLDDSAARIWHELAEYSA
jgi:predicted outer membrane protein